MGTFFFLFFGVLFVIIIFKITTSTKMVANDEAFSQAGVRVDFKSGTISIGRYTYDVNLVQGIESKQTARFGMEVSIRVDDFKHPIHKVTITGMNDAGEKFVQRLSTALRKAGGPSFY